MIEVPNIKTHGDLLESFHSMRIDKGEDVNMYYCTCRFGSKCKFAHDVSKTSEKAVKNDDESRGRSRSREGK